MGCGVRRWRRWRLGVGHLVPGCQAWSGNAATPARERSRAVEVAPALVQLGCQAANLGVQLRLERVQGHGAACEGDGASAAARARCAYLAPPRQSSLDPPWHRLAPTLRLSCRKARARREHARTRFRAFRSAPSRRPSRFPRITGLVQLVRAGLALVPGLGRHVRRVRGLIMMAKGSHECREANKGVG